MCHFRVKKMNKKELDKIASLGCIACRYLGYGYTPAMIHHIRRHGGKRDNSPVIPLCPTHHQFGGKGVAVHAGRESFEQNIATEEYLLGLVKDLLK